MREIASKGQLRLAYLRWAMVTVPLILLLGFASGRLVPSGSDNSWFVHLAKPAAYPPEWLFPVAWGVLYILLGLSLAMVINARGSRHRSAALLFFVLQMVPNLAWSPVFFGMHRIGAALAILVALFILALFTTILFRRVRRGAALLLLPYLAWIAYAGFLLYQIDVLNPDGGTLAPGRAADQIRIQ